jgi:hypothetical protein
MSGRKTNCRDSIIKEPSKSWKSSPTVIQLNCLKLAASFVETKQVPMGFMLVPRRVLRKVAYNLQKIPHSLFHMVTDLATLGCTVLRP